MLSFPSKNDKKISDWSVVLKTTNLGDANQHIFKSGLTVAIWNIWNVYH